MINVTCGRRPVADDAETGLNKKKREKQSELRLISKRNVMPVVPAVITQSVVFERDTGRLFSLLMLLLLRRQHGRSANPFTMSDN